MSETYYKIRRKSDGMFYASHYSWTKGGKIWKQIGHLRSHITNNSHNYENGDLSDLEVVSFKVIEDVADPLKEYVIEAKFRREEKVIKDGISRMKYKLKRDIDDHKLNELHLYALELRLEKLYSD